MSNKKLYSFKFNKHDVLIWQEIANKYFDGNLTRTITYLSNKSVNKLTKTEKEVLKAS